MNYGIRIVGLMFSISFVLKRCESQRCHEYRSADGLSVANCTNLNFNDVPIFPDDVQVIDLTKNPNFPLQRGFLKKYSGTLRRLILHNTAMVTLYKSPSTLDVFCDLHNLEDFEFSDSELQNTERWVLPPNLKKYNVDTNMYTHLDVSWCAELEELSVNNNLLEGMPKLHRAPLPPLKVFRAKNNPLPKLTILDLAPLCYLQELELEFTSESYLSRAEGFCNCSLFKYYANEMGIKGVQNLRCSTEPEASKTPCSNDTLQEARKIRKICPLLTKGPLPSQIRFTLKMVFLSILLLLLLATAILYIIRHFHLREWWRLHHNKFQPTPRTEEEEEQSLQTGSSISDGSVDDERTNSE